MPTYTDTQIPTPTAHNPVLACLTDRTREAALALTEDCVAPLAQSAVLRASGVDTDEFLQGQISVDIRQIDVAHARLAAYSSPKGRMLAALQLTRRDDAVLLKLHHSVAAATLKRLRMFVLRAKVEMEDASSALPGLGLWGPNAENALIRLGLPVPAYPLDMAARAAVQVIRQHAPENAAPRFELRGPTDDIAALWPQVAAHANPVGSDAWRLLDTLAGVPTIYPATSDHFVAQMTNLDLLGGISFDKGCYTGQEVIARLHYLGRLKRRMFLLRADTAAPAPGTPIHAHGGAQSVGEVVDANADGNGGCAIVAVLKLDSAHSPTLRLGDAEGPPLSTPSAFATAQTPAERS